MSVPNMAHVRAPMPDAAPTQDRPKGWVDLPQTDGSIVTVPVDWIGPVEPGDGLGQSLICAKHHDIYYVVPLSRAAVLSLIAKAQQS